MTLGHKGLQCNMSSELRMDLRILLIPRKGYMTARNFRFFHEIPRNTSEPSQIQNLRWVEWRDKT